MNRKQAIGLVIGEILGDVGAFLEPLETNISRQEVRVRDLELLDPDGHPLRWQTETAEPCDLAVLRVQGTLRFEWQGADVKALECRAAALNRCLKQARLDLFKRGFQIFDQSGEGPVPDPPSAIWHTDYHMLYQHRINPVCMEESLRVRLPINLDFPGKKQTKTVDPGCLMRWEPHHASNLEIRGPVRIGKLSVSLFAEGLLPTGTVTIQKNLDRGGCQDISCTNLAALTHRSRVALSPRNVRVTFPSMADFLAELRPEDCSLVFKMVSDPANRVTLQGFVHDFGENPIVLPSARDKLTIFYGKRQAQDADVGLGTPVSVDLRWFRV